MFFSQNSYIHNAIIKLIIAFIQNNINHIVNF